MVLGVLVATIVLIVLVWWWHGRRMKRVRAQGAWPTAMATIQSSATREVEERDHEGARQMVYYPDVAFSYAAGGQTHVGKTIQPDSVLSYFRRDQAEACCARYPVGGEAKVRYNPAAPSEAYLQIPKADLGMPITLTIAVLVTGFFTIGSLAGA